MNLKKSDLTRRQRQAEPSPLTVPGGHYRRGAFSAFAADVLPVDDHDRNIAALKQSDLSLAVGGDRHRLGNAIELEIAQSFLLGHDGGGRPRSGRSEEHTSELQSLMRISYAVFCLKKKILKQNQT